MDYIVVVCFRFGIITSAVATGEGGRVECRIPCGKCDVIFGYIYANTTKFEYFSYLI